MNQEVAVIEAMKMQNQIKAPRTGLVKSVNTQKGKSVPEGEVLVDFYPATETRVFAPVEGTVTGVESITVRPRQAMGELAVGFSPSAVLLKCAAAWGGTPGPRGGRPEARHRDEQRRRVRHSRQRRRRAAFFRQGLGPAPLRGGMCHLAHRLAASGT